MIYTLFFSKLRDLSPAEMEEYNERAFMLKAKAAAEQPAFVGIKTYVAEDGERLTVVQFRDAASQRAWKLEPEHLEAQARGRTHYYEEFRIVICEEVRSRGFVRSDASGNGTSTTSLGGCRGR